MPVAGTKETARLAIAPFGEDTVATLTVTSPTGTVTHPGVSPSGDDNSVWESDNPIEYTVEGEWILRWVVTGTGASPADIRVQVGPAAGHLGRTYATTADLAAYLDAAPPRGAHRRLVKATREIDQLILSATYTVTGDDEMPTDTKIRQALRDATCALATWWSQTGDEYGSAFAVGPASIGGVTIGAPKGTVSGQYAGSARVGPEVFTILNQAGLLGQEPVAW